MIIDCCDHQFACMIVFINAWETCSLLCRLEQARYNSSPSQAHRVRMPTALLHQRGTK